MSCDEIREKLSLYLEGELPDTERGEVDRHLPACAACTETLSLLREVAAGLSRVEEAEPPLHLARKIQSAIAEKARPQRRPAWWGSWAPALAVAAVVLLTIGTVTYLDISRVQEEPIIPKLERPAEAPAPTSPPSPPTVEPQAEMLAAPSPQPAKAKPEPKKEDKRAKLLREAPVPLGESSLRPAEKPAAPALGDLRKDEAPAAPSPSIAAKGRGLAPRMERDKVSEVRSQAREPAVTAGRKDARTPDAVPAAVIIMSDPMRVEQAKTAILILGGKLRQEPRKAPELRALTKEYRLGEQEAPSLEYVFPRARYHELILRLQELDPKMTAPSLGADTRDSGRKTLTLRLEVRKPTSP